MNLDALKAMSRPELVEFAGKQGVRVHHKAKPENIIKAIVEATLAPKPSMEHAAAAPVKPVDHNTAEEVELAIKAIKAKCPEFTSTYNTHDNSWHFKYRGAEDCGNLDIPLRIILTKAQTVSRGALKLLGLNQHFDATNAGGNNAYTNNVLSV